MQPPSLFLIFILITLIPLCSPSSFSYSGCSSTQILDPSTLSCISCPSTMRPNPLQKIPTSCICLSGYYPTSLTACTLLSSATCATSQYLPVLADNGVYSTGSSSYTCTACSSNSYANENGTKCELCQRNQVYSTTESACTCTSTSGYIQTDQGCYSTAETSSTSGLGASSSNYYNYLKYLLPNCGYFGDLLSCSFLANLCTYSMGYGTSTSAECNFFNTFSAYKTMQFVNTSSSQFYMSPSTFSKSEQMSFKLLKFLPTGNFVQQKQLKLTDILRCGMPSNNSATIQIGNNIQVSCTYDFDYLAQSMSTFSYKNYLYQLFLKGENSQYFPVYIYIGSSTTPVTRFFLEDTFTSSSYINVLTGFEFSVSLNSTGYLNTPKVTVSYTKLSVQSSAITPSSDSSQKLTYSIKFIYNLSSFWAPFLGIFIAISIIAVIQSLIRTYVAHLNRQSLLSFFYYFANFWSLWMFYFLMVISGYWFLFSKTTQGVYIFTPSTYDSFYVVFYLLAGLMGLFRIVTVLYDKKQKLNYQVFMINWEKGKNSWREIFIINSLAQFYTHRTISFFWMLLVLMFFLVGINWQVHAAEVMHTNSSLIYYFNPVNRVFLYFLGSTILLVIGIVFKILRRLSVLSWPYPLQDFVDYCNVTNISFFFMRKRSVQAYYIHASIPDRVQVTYKEINQAIRRGLNKNRNILKEHSLHDSQKMYTVYVCKDLQDKFNNMLKRCQDEQVDKISAKHSQKQLDTFKKGKKQAASPRQQFIQKKLKPYLEDISRQGSNKTKSTFNRILGLPPIDLRDQKALKDKNQVLFDDSLDIVKQVFPNGDQFQQIHTIIIIFLMFLLMTANIPAAAVLTYFVDHFMINRWIQGTCKQNLQKMTKVKEGFML